MELQLRMYMNTSLLVQDPYRYSPPAGGSSNCPTTVVSSTASLAWIRNPRNDEAFTVDSNTTARNDNSIMHSQK